MHGLRQTVRFEPTTKRSILPSRLETALGPNAKAPGRPCTAAVARLARLHPNVVSAKSAQIATVLVLCAVTANKAFPRLPRGINRMAGMVCLSSSDPLLTCQFW